MLIHELAEHIAVVPADTLDNSDTLREQNPLGKMPCLILEDSGVIFDSRVIVEYLDSLAKSPRLVPTHGRPRFDVMTRAVLYDGITDAALLMVYEKRFRTDEQVSMRWLDHQRGKLLRALANVTHELPSPTHTDLASMALACALAYLDWRKPIEWRESYPSLVAWLENFSDHEPSFLQTAP